ncbi:vanadium-dependent haloperoxidase [Hymenobacter negativus]|uniref:Vanadium-dependent haloperoxidase n=1 Tax=Hymenobacter negativus TaxID=2795026 RepID=A0ABS3QAQ8_9BACT|nr:vanadium-dependent haloperoxidase [Hymenobacter negativus]MBO2008345.1 vanadium-dependent haloperoxidase [Hymenobacter negativus]
MITSSSSPGSVVLAWNNIYLDVVRRIGGAPGPLARIGGLMHLAMYEAVNRLTPAAHYPALIDDNLLSLPTAGMPDPATSAAYAACYALTTAVEDYVTTTKQMQGGVLNPFDPFQVHPAADPHTLGLAVNTGAVTTIDTAASEAYGKAIAEGVLKAYPADTGLSMDVDPPLDPTPGEWRETGSGPALTPQWGTVPLFLLASQPATDYLPTTIPNNLLSYPALLASPLYAEQVAEVKLLGEAHAAARTPEQTEIAFFWANDLNGTSKPPGQLYTIAQDVAKQQGTPQNLLNTARLFAMVGTAMVNASIVAWQAKYFNPSAQSPLRLWRPETAIQLADTDGNPSTAADPTWQPLSATVSGTRFSPNFPAYVSGHSTFGAAWAVVMQAFYGRDDISFTATTEDPHAFRDENGIRRTRHFSSFTQAALENGRSRVYLGVHYQFDANGGYEIGTKVGEDTAKVFADVPRQG